MVESIFASIVALVTGLFSAYLSNKTDSFNDDEVKLFISLKGRNDHISKKVSQHLTETLLIKEWKVRHPFQSSLYYCIAIYFLVLGIYELFLIIGLLVSLLQHNWEMVQQFTGGYIDNAIVEKRFIEYMMLFAICWGFSFLFFNIHKYFALPYKPTKKKTKKETNQDNLVKYISENEINGSTKNQSKGISKYYKYYYK